MNRRYSCILLYILIPALLLTACMPLPETVPSAFPTQSGSTNTTTFSAQKKDGIQGIWVSYFELNAIFSAMEAPEQARQAIDAIMERALEYRLNAVFFHVRANSDAYYPSMYYRYADSVSALIQKGFDPLAYAVAAAHSRGLQLHAWVNPYRVGEPQNAVAGVPTLTAKNGWLYYVPTARSSQTLILTGVRELVTKYDVDGIQYDDYFYPQKELEVDTVYAYEAADYQQYQKQGGQLSVADWRRASVDSLIASTHSITQAAECVFGVAPSHDAQSNNTEMYADTLKWLSQSGYVDYLCPQLYFGFDNETQPFATLVDRWLTYPRHESVTLYVGLALYKIGLKEDTYAGMNGIQEWVTHDDVMKRSVLYLREQGITGVLFYSYSYLVPQLTVQTQDATVARRELENLLSVL